MRDAAAVAEVLARRAGRRWENSLRRCRRRCSTQSVVQLVRPAAHVASLSFLSLSPRGYKRHANLDKSSGRGGWTDAPEEPREQHPPGSGNVLPGSVNNLCKLS